MAKCVRAAATAQAVPNPCILVRVAIKSSAADGSFSIKDGDAGGDEILGDDNVLKDRQTYGIEVGVDVTKLHVTISKCVVYLYIT